MKLEDFGLQNYRQKIQAELPETSNMARVAIQNKYGFLLYAEQGEKEGVLRGKLLKIESDLPKVGDWVRVSEIPEDGKLVIEEVLPRFSALARKEAGRRSDIQTIVSNVDYVFVVQGMDGNFNLSRLDRYLVTIGGSGAEAIILLNKCDLAENLGQALDLVKSKHPQLKVLAVSAKTGLGMPELTETIEPGLTYALIGSSGVGKSTIVNALAGQNVMDTQDVRQTDSKGRHTTTRREMVITPQGGILIDTPGMRELGLAVEQEAVGQTFAELEELSRECKFSDCNHIDNPGCAILPKVEDGQIDVSSYQNFLKLGRETEFQESKTDWDLYRRRKEEAKSRSKLIKNVIKSKYRK